MIGVRLLRVAIAAERFHFLANVLPLCGIPIGSFEALAKLGKHCFETLYEPSRINRK